jgi:hypothetical protein
MELGDQFYTPSALPSGQITKYLSFVSGATAMQILNGACGLAVA